MTVLYYLVLILHLIACFFLIAVVLLQQGKGQDLASAFGGGGTQAAFGPRGSATLLSRVTTALAAVFMITSISLAVLKHKQASILDTIPGAATTVSPTPAVGPTNVLGVPVAPAGSPSPASSSPASTTGSPTPSATPSASPAASVVVVPATGGATAVAPVAVAPAKPSVSPKP